MLTNAQQEALKILINKLSKNHIPFIVIGGLAAIAWGAKRPLADIDIQIKHKDMPRVINLFKENIIQGLRHYVTEKWDIYQMILNLEGVGIDVCEAENFYVVSDSRKQRVSNEIDTPILLDVAGIEIPVISKKSLLAYKEIVGREVDRDDLNSLKTQL